jgi:hypothetical protein
MEDPATGEFSHGVFVFYLHPTAKPQLIFKSLAEFHASLSVIQKINFKFSAHTEPSQSNLIKSLS